VARAAGDAALTASCMGTVVELTVHVSGSPVEAGSDEDAHPGAGDHAGAEGG